MEKICRRISEIGTVVGGGTPSTKNPDYWGGGIPWISPKDLTDYKSVYISKGENFLTEKGLKSGTRLLPKNTLLFSSRAPIGYVALAANPICTNQGFKSIVCDEKQVVPLYLYYYMKANLDYIKLFGTGATFPEISGKTMGKIKVEIFKSLDVQHRIASILSTYDSLIENNTKRISLLEKMAENLYKEWFVRFRFPGHENVEMENGLPKGWKYYRIEDLCDINRETIKIANAPKDILYLDTGSVTRGKISDVESLTFADAPSRARRIVRNDSIIYSTVRPNLQHYGILKNPPSNLLVSTGFAVLDCKEEIANIVYLALSHPSVYRYCSLIADCAVATYPSIKPKEIGRIYIALPKMSVCKRWNEKIESYYKMINKLQHQNSLLARQRDLLLPRLMSDKLEVKEELLE